MHFLLALVDGMPSTDCHGQGNAMYQLAGCTVSGPGHFSGAFQASAASSLRHGWFLYDGLVGHRSVGLPPCPPPGYCLSYVMFSLLSPDYAYDASKFLSWYLD